jgi:cell division protein WhiA
MAEGGFTDAVRQELARLPLGDRAAVRTELAALLRLAGSITVHGGAAEEERVTLALDTTSGAVARRVFALLQHGYGLRAELVVHAPGGVRRNSTYTVRVRSGAHDVGRDLGVMDESGRPAEALPGRLSRTAATAYLRGAFLARGSLSAPGRAPHLEIAVRSPDLARALAVVARGLLGGTVTATVGQRPRVVIKSGETIGELLTSIGATGAFLAWDDRRLRRQLRSDATRLANADSANLQRTIEAAAGQVRAVEDAVASHGWEALDEEVRAVALARLANPAATLTEIGELLDPPLAKSVVHRRLKRLERLAYGDDGR